MSKNLIKLLILLVVITLVYSVFWFFKVGQVEKKINNFISENSAHISAAEVVVSGFPLSQKVSIKDLKFNFPNQVFGNRQILIKNLEANTGIFANEFSLNIPMDGVSTTDASGVTLNVTFNQQPIANFSLNSEGFASFSYQDYGYKILDNDQKTVYAAASSQFNFYSVVEGEKIVNKIKADIKEIEGFEVIDMYKNSFEKKIIEGIKTGEITLGSASSVISPTDVNIAAPMPTPEAAVVQASAVATTDATPIANNNSIDASLANQSSNDAAATIPTQDPASTPEVVKEVFKNNFSMDIEYSLVPVAKSVDQAAPTDPTQIQEAPTQYSKLIKINNLEFSNSLYKILVNGELNSFQDDNSPSGSIGIKVEKIDNLVDLIILVICKNLKI
jgi:hypothetical protein